MKYAHFVSILHLKKWHDFNDDPERRTCTCLKLHQNLLSETAAAEPATIPFVKLKIVISEYEISNFAWWLVADTFKRSVHNKSSQVIENATKDKEEKIF